MKRSSPDAWDQLTPKTKARVSQLLRLNPDQPDWTDGFPSKQKSKAAFTRASGWADDIKRKSDYTDDGETPFGPVSSRNIGYADKLMHRCWHYKDIPFSPDNTPTHDVPDPNAETQIIAFRDTLASQAASDDLKSYDLVGFSTLSAMSISRCMPPPALRMINRSIAHRYFMSCQTEKVLDSI